MSFTYIQQNTAFYIVNSLVFGIVVIVDEIANGFMEIKYTIGVFADLSEGFDTVNQ